MMAECSVRDKLEYLKLHMYEELNQLKNRLSQEASRDMEKFNSSIYKPTKHKKSYKRNCTYRKYIRSVQKI